MKGIPSDRRSFLSRSKVYLRSEEQTADHGTKLQGPLFGSNESASPMNWFVGMLKWLRKTPWASIKSLLLYFGASSLSHIPTK